jgi:hypothetical protein
MSSRAATSDALPPAEPRRTRWQAVRGVVAFSLSVTAAAALVALAVSRTSGARFLLAFVILRWCLVGVLLATPLVHQVSIRFGARWRLPWALRTPATALLLTCESILFDIASAHLG